MLGNLYMPDTTKVKIVNIGGKKDCSRNLGFSYIGVWGQKAYTTSNEGQRDLKEFAWGAHRNLVQEFDSRPKTSRS